MIEAKRCPYCGSTEIKITDKKENKYLCHACMQEFIPKERKPVVKSAKALSPDKRQTFFSKLMDQVVTINAFFKDNISAGSGFYVSPDYILTNAHVVFCKSGNLENSPLILADDIISKNYDKTKVATLELVFADNDLDIAILKTDKPSSSKVAFSSSMYIGEQLFAIGNSRGEGLCVLEGIVSDTDRIIHGNKFFMTSALVTKGSSGGPLFDSEGKLLGMTTEKSASEVAMNYAIPSSVLIKFIKEVQEKEEITIIG